MCPLTVQQTLGFTADDVLARRYNLWVGISQSKWFEDHLEKLITWACSHTRDRLLVLVPGRMYAVNVNHIEGMTRALALKYGYEVEAKIRKQIEAISLPHGCPRIRLADYDEILTPNYVRRRSLLFREFSQEGEFYTRISEIAADFLAARGRTVRKKMVEAAALYQR